MTDQICVYEVNPSFSINQAREMASAEIAFVCAKRGCRAGPIIEGVSTVGGWHHFEAIFTDGEGTT